MVAYCPGKGLTCNTTVECLGGGGGEGGRDEEGGREGGKEGEREGKKEEERGKGRNWELETRGIEKSMSYREMEEVRRKPDNTFLHLEHFLAVVISSPHTLQHSNPSSDSL